MKTSTAILTFLGLGALGVAGYYIYKKYFSAWGGKIILTKPVVQYVWDEDKPAADIIANALSIPSIKTDTDAPLYAGEYAEWILIGGQVSNPIYSLMTTQATPPLPLITQSNPLNYSKSKFNGLNAVYGIAGWDIANTQAIAQKFVNDYQGI